MDYDKLKEKINEIYQISKSRNWYVHNSLQIERSATVKELNELENAIGKKLPSQLKNLLTNLSKSINLFYQIEEEIPKEFGQIYSGEFDYNLQLIKNLNQDFSEWIDASLDEFSNDIESIEITKKIKENKTAFLSVSTGDIIAIDDITNEVIYFDHEGDSMHGKKLGKDLNAFLEQWSEMGFFGIEGWQFEEMYDFTNNKFRTKSDIKVNNWINWLHKKPVTNSV